MPPQCPIRLLARCPAQRSAASPGAPRRSASSRADPHPPDVAALISALHRPHLLPRPPPSSPAPTSPLDSIPPNPNNSRSADLSADDSPWSDGVWSDDDEGSLPFEDSGEGSDAESDGTAEEDEAVEESDSSEDEVAPRNTVGDVPLEWYKNEEHIGYDIDGRKIKKRDREGAIDKYLNNADDAKN